MKLCRHLHIDAADQQLMVTTLILSLPPLNLPHLSNPAAYYNTTFKYQSIPPKQALSSKTGFLVFSMCLYFASFSIPCTSDNYHQAVTHTDLSLSASPRRTNKYYQRRIGKQQLQDVTTSLL